MNCRKANSLLSAYIDRELTGAEMLDVRAHVERCADCQAEVDDLLQTKRMLSSLSYTAPRADLEALLVAQAIKQASHTSLLDRVLPPEWSDRMLWRWEGVGNLGSPRLRPLAATALLSLAGLCLATASVNRPGDETPFGDVSTAQSFAVYVGPTGTLTRVPLMPPINSDTAYAVTNGNATLPISLTQTPSGGGAWQTMATSPFPGAVRQSDALPAGWENDLLVPASGANATPVGYFPQTGRKSQFSIVIWSRR